MRQVLDRLLGRGKGNQVAQPLAAGKDRQQPALVLGEQIAAQLGVGQPGHLEVKIVQNGIFDAGVGQVAGQGLLPDPLGHPHAADRRAQPVLQPAAIGANLPDAVAGRDHRQNRFVERPAQDLDPTFAGQLRQPVHVFAVLGVEPLHQRTAGVQGDSQRGIAAEDFEEGQVAVLIGLLENVVEIANRAGDCEGRESVGLV